MTKKTGFKTTAFSEFIRTATPAEKERVYSEVLKNATDKQVNTLRQSVVTKKTT